MTKSKSNKAARRETGRTVPLYELPKTALFFKYDALSATLPDGSKMYCNPVVGMPHILISLGGRQFLIDATDAIRAALDEAGFEGAELVPASSEDA